MSENKKKDDCPEESKTHGDSPFGIVKDEEMLARFVLLSDEDSVDSRNFCIRRGALQTKDFQKRDGWSLVRRDCAGNMAVALEKHANERGKRGEEYGYALVNTADIREILDKERRRAICVIDDPQEGMPEHALAKKARDYKRGEVRRIRDKFLKKFELKKFTEILID